MTHNPIIIALDVDSAEQASQMVDILGDSVDFYKVGIELYAAAGMEFVRRLIGGGKQVFLDMKFYDIGEQVKRAVAQVARTGVSFLTIHARPSVMRAAVEGKGASDLKLLAVTVLTSLTEADLAEAGYPGTVAQLVDSRVQNAVDAGVDGIVCSPLEVERVRRMTGEGKILVTPGVRSEGTSRGDQKRVATPAQAILAGADYLVIGRQVTRSPHPRAEIDSILKEIEGNRPVGAAKHESV